jgi:hypothetical protein
MDNDACGAAVVFGGDPHGKFSPILRACAAMPAATLVLLGDCDCDRPLPAILAPLLDAGWMVRWILGNHDTETEAGFDNLVGGCPRRRSWAAGGGGRRAPAGRLAGRVQAAGLVSATRTGQ